MKTAMMNITVGLAAILSLGAAAGCVQAVDSRMMEDGTEIDSTEDIGEAAQAIDTNTPSPNPQYFRLRFKHTTAIGTPTCFEPVDAVVSAPIVHRLCNTNAPSAQDPQSFYVENPTARTGGYRKIRYAKDPSFCLHVAGFAGGVGGMDNGAALILYPCIERDNQWYYLDAVQADGYSVIRASHSNKTLTTPGSSIDPNAIVDQYNAASPIGDAWFIFRDAGKDSHGNPILADW